MVRSIISLLFMIPFSIITEHCHKHFLICIRISGSDRRRNSLHDEEYFGHKVCRGNIDPCSLLCSENINTGMPRKRPTIPIMDIFCLPLHSRDQTADTTDHHINVYSCTGCFYKLVHNTFICQRIHFQTDICLFSGS